VSAGILIVIALIGIYFGYRLFCTGPAEVMRRISGAALAILGVALLVNAAQHRKPLPVRTQTHMPGASAPRGHSKIGVEQFI
jgi:uncharacterized membrane protein YfcA